MARLSLLALATVASGLFAQTPAPADPVDALRSGKVSLELRTRYEHVNDEATRLGADAVTNRLVLTYKSAAWKGFSLTAQAENVAVLGSTRYRVGAPVNYGPTDHAVVNDPPLTQMNQLYLEGYGLKVGRQSLAFDNQRFIGTVGWRQNDQTFTGATFTNATWIPKTEFTLGHLTKAHTILGVTKEIKAEVANLHFTFIPKGHLRAFHYAFEEPTAPTKSFAHTGGRLDGEAWRILYDASFASQKAYKDATALTVPDAKYRYLGLGFKFAEGWSLSAAEERLEAGFNTPYATLHAWNGWADKLTVTPAKGLRDAFGTFKGKAGKFAFEAAYHRYKADKDDTSYGKEWNAQVAFKATAWLDVLLKGADYKGDATAPGALAKDMRKVWVQTQMRF